MAVKLSEVTGCWQVWQKVCHHFKEIRKAVKKDVLEHELNAKER